MDAAKRFFTQSREVVGHGPEQAPTDGHDAYPRAIRETLGPEVLHRCSRYRNNVMEQRAFSNHLLERKRWLSEKLCRAEWLT